MKKDNISTFINDAVYDIANGFCGNQQINNPNQKSCTLKTIQKIKHINKTKIPDIISNALLSSGYQNDYLWKHEKVFVANGNKYEILEYDISTGDICYLLENGKSKKYTKKVINQIYQYKTGF